MTLTIDPDPVEEARLTAAAHQEGVAPAMLLKRMVNGPPVSPGQGASAGRERARVAAIHAARGSMAHVGATADDLHRERQGDEQDEERAVLGSSQ